MAISGPLYKEQRGKKKLGAVKKFRFERPLEGGQCLPVGEVRRETVCELLFSAHKFMQNRMQ